MSFLVTIVLIRLVRAAKGDALSEAAIRAAIEDAVGDDADHLKEEKARAEAAKRIRSASQRRAGDVCVCVCVCVCACLPYLFGSPEECSVEHRHPSRKLR